MPKWLVRLKGEKFDLEDLPGLLTEPSLNVIEEGGSFYLRSSEFDTLSSPEEVREKAQALIKLLNGAAKFHRENFLPVSEDCVTCVSDDGSRTHNVFLEATVSVRAKMSAALTVKTPNSHQPVVQQPSQVQCLIDIAKKHKEIADVLHFISDDTWFSFYKAYELIRDDVGGHHQLLKKKWVPNADLRRFTQTAECRAVLGDAARHASKKYKTPVHPMSLSEGRVLLKTMFLNWWRTKL